jgi:AFG3 family protein
MNPKPQKTPARQNSKQKPPEGLRFNWWIIYIVIFGLLIFLPYLTSSGAKEITWQYFEQNILSKNAVKNLVVINNEKVEVYLKEEAAKEAFFKDVSKTGVNRLGRIF